MWSLPDISRMNAEAATQQDKFKLACETGELDGEKLECEWHGHDDPSQCEGELRHYLWFDIFSDDPKGIVTLCEHHDGYYGSPSEGYFECDGCNRVFAENYTWELYYAIHEGSQLCLPCFAYEVLRDEERWIPLTDERIDALTFNHVRKAPHCIGVRMPVPKEIRFVNNVEFDSMDGHCISGGGLDELKETLRTLQEEGETKAILILDAAYQFAVSIGVYAPTHEPGEMAEPELKVAYA
jgi:hypothetical protein